MKDPIKLLFNEHEIISSAVNIAFKADILIGKNDELYSFVINKLLEFFRGYADIIHHNKENLILFPEMVNKNELLKDGIIKEMYNNHDEFREMINSVEYYLLKKDYLRTQQQMHVYAEALLNHIAVENDEVFQIAEMLFIDKELENIYFRFIDADNEMLLNTKPNLEKQINELMKLF